MSMEAEPTENPEEEALSDEEMADQSEAMTSGEDDGAGEGSGDGAGEGEGDGDGEEGADERVLDQDEIDNLLGFDGPGRDNADDGMSVLINSALVNYERLPMLEVVYDRLVRLMTTSLRNFTSDNVEVSIDSIQSIRFGDYLNSIPLPAMLGVFRAEEWDNYGLLTVDSSLIYSIVDVLLGGRHGTAAMRIEGRPYTTIERNLVERMIKIVLVDLSAAFDPLTKVEFRFDRLETNPRFAAIARSANAAITVRMRVEMDDRGGNIELVLPYATLEPIRDLLLQMFSGEKFGRDSIWETHLAGELWNMSLDIDAVLDEQMLSLDKVASLCLGDTLMLQAQPNSPVVLRCGRVNILKGHMGHAGNRVAIRVDETLLERGEAI